MRGVPPTGSLRSLTPFRQRGWPPIRRSLKQVRQNFGQSNPTFEYGSNLFLTYRGQPPFFPEEPQDSGESTPMAGSPSIPSPLKSPVANHVNPSPGPDVSPVLRNGDWKVPLLLPRKVKRMYESGPIVVFAIRSSFPFSVKSPTMAPAN
jgi:hypothetical protein